jgi:predicted DNA-binding transcriptional regulator AlpA
MGRLHTLREVCAAARMSISKLFRLRRAGQGPREITLGRTVLVSEAALREWLAGQEHNPRRRGTLPAPAQGGR